MKAKDTRSFIEMVRQRHGDRYDYSETIYKRSTEKLVVLCREHGPFFTLPSNHLKGRGCPECAKEVRAKKRTTSRAEFLRRAVEVHGAKYDYKSVEYTTLSDSIIIECDQHGRFRQCAREHLQGKGCAKCGRLKAARSKTFSTARFIEKAREVHGHKYDYSAVCYVTMHDKIQIRCPDHGEFLQKAANHITGNGCPSCGGDRNRERFALSEKLVKQRIKTLYGDAVECEEVVYVNSKTKIQLNCHKHGPFKQYPLHLMRGVGCPVCGKARTAQKLSMPLEEFVRKATLKHRGAYVYDQVSYANLRDDITIICRRHGAFDQGAFPHLSGAGCPKCKSSRGESAIIDWLVAWDLHYVHQWSDHQCIINSRPAKFDFYLPEFAVVIEFDGEQHFKVVKFGSSVTDAEAQARLRAQVISDRKKDRWAIAEGLKMVRVRYDEDVAECLDRELLPVLI